MSITAYAVAVNRDTAWYVQYYGTVFLQNDIIVHGTAHSVDNISCMHGFIIICYEGLFNHLPSKVIAKENGHGGHAVNIKEARMWIHGAHHRTLLHSSSSAAA